MQSKKTILTFISFYLPGYKSGGPVRSISNTVNVLSDKYNFKIITRDRDQLENKPYDSIKPNEWNIVNNTQVFYSDLTLSLKRVINNTEFDIYYLNSLFALNFSIKIMIWKWLKLIPQKPVLLAPRGELSEGAISFKQHKKKLFLFIVKLLGIYKGITWHASTLEEAKAINKVFGKDIKIKTALDIPSFEKKQVKEYHKKQSGKLKILFISSIARNKNLKFVIETLNKINGNFTLDIYGPIKDKKYWEECNQTIKLSLKGKINYKGVISYNNIHNVYPNYDLFFFPTYGESFGHVIFESLLYNCPVLCSDKIPFNNLSSFNAGWNIPLQNHKEFLNRVELLIPMNNNEFNQYRIGCENFIDHFKHDKSNTKHNYELFDIT